MYIIENMINIDEIIFLRKIKVVEMTEEALPIAFFALN